MGRGRPRVPVDVQRRFWQLIREEGLTPVEACEAAGVSRSVARRWFVEAGGVISSIVVQPSGYRLSFAEREEIAHLNSARVGVSEIARRLGRDKSTISRELRRTCVGRRGYRASVAQNDAEDKARRPKPAKLATNL